MKQGEVDYLENLGSAGTMSAFDKPFSEHACAKNRVGMGLVMSPLPAPTARVFDLGCGTGWTSWSMASHGDEVVGQDIASDMIDLANRNRERRDVEHATFIDCEYEALPYEAEFDAALFYDSLHPAEDEGAATCSAYRSLRPGGLQITHEPGLGQASSVESLAAIERFGVSEKDMPPAHVYALAKIAGFPSVRRPVDPTALFRTVYGVNLGSRRTEQGLHRRLRSAAELLHRIVDNRKGAICVLRK